MLNYKKGSWKTRALFKKHGDNMKIKVIRKRKIAQEISTM